MTPDAIETLFTRADGRFAFARWGRPITPVIFGVSDETLGILKGAIEAMVALADHQIADHDPELGANLMMFFLKDWKELTEVPKLDQLIPDFSGLIGRLQAAKANQYRAFRFDEAGGIRACFTFVKLDAAMALAPAETIAMTQALHAMLLWSDRAFEGASPFVAGPDGAARLKPEIADVVRAAYDKALPVASKDKAHALRLAARTARPM